MTKHSEAANAADAAAVHVSRDMTHAEVAHAEGTYNVVCMAPAPEDAARYVLLHDMLAEMQANRVIEKMRAGHYLAESVLRLDRQIARLQNDIAQIPLFEKWTDTVENLVVNVGKNLALDTILAGSAFTATVVMGLTGATPTPAAGDTQASHAGWIEVGAANAPQYSGTRKTPSWSAASAGSKATSAAVSFVIATTGGTVGGCFLNINGSSAIDNTTGTLYSAGAFTGGNRAVVVGDTLNVTYTGTM